MNDKFELNGLNEVYNEALRRNETTLVFEILNGRGRFLFMMFFDEEDKSTKDQLFIFLKSTKKMLQFKMYGNHSKGTFSIFIDELKRKLFIDELQLNGHNNSNPFVFDTFFNNINSSIPKSLPLAEKMTAFKHAWEDVKSKIPSDLIDELDKKFLIGPRSLPANKKPQEKTLRKLYLFAEGGTSDEISQFIERLKKLNMTVAWTDDESKINANIHTLLMSI
jgi:hypothetical protein